MEHRQRADRLGRGSGIADTPELLGSGTHHAILHLWHSRARIELFGGEGAHQRLVAEGIGCGALLERHSADGLHVILLTRQRTHHVELIACDGIGVFGGIHLPFQLNRTGIFQFLGGLVV